MSQIFFDTLYHSVTGYKIFAMVSVAIVSLVGTFSPLFLLSCSANFKVRTRFFVFFFFSHISSRIF